MKSLQELLPAFTEARKSEDDRLFVAFDRCFISAYNPRITDQVNRQRINARVGRLKIWIKQWWSDRGYCLSWSPNPDDGEFDVPGFTLRTKR